MIPKLNYLLIISLTFMALGASEANAKNFSTSINPMVIKIEATSPSLIRAPISIENSSDQNITYSIFLRPFKANSDLNGEPNFDPILSEEYKTFFEKISIIDRGNALEEITLSPFQKKDLRLIIPVSDETEKRDYYFTAIFLSQSASAEAKTTKVSNKAGIGANVLLTVGSKTEASGAISKFNIPKFFSTGPVYFELELSNTSDHFVTSKGNVIIKNMFGQTVGNVEIKPTTLLQNSSRIISDSDNKLAWNEKFLLGIYKADLSVAISDKGPLLHESRIFFALPIKALFIVISIFLIFTWTFRAARARNRKN